MDGRLRTVWEEPATGQRCRLCCRLLGALPTLNSAAKIREFYTKLLYRFSITNPKSVADSLPAHFPASQCMSRTMQASTWSHVAGPVPCRERGQQHGSAGEVADPRPDEHHVALRTAAACGAPPGLQGEQSCRAAACKGSSPMRDALKALP